MKMFIKVKSVPFKMAQNSYLILQEHPGITGPLETHSQVFARPANSVLTPIRSLLCH